MARVIEYGSQERFALYVLDGVDVLCLNGVLVYRQLGFKSVRRLGNVSCPRPS
jgi:hypothetical protein